MLKIKQELSYNRIQDKLKKGLEVKLREARLKAAAEGLELIKEKQK
jgi:hypothetical protein